MNNTDCIFWKKKYLPPAALLVNPLLLLVGIYSQPIASETNYYNTILNINSLLLSGIRSNMVHSEDNFSSLLLKGRSQLFDGDNGEWDTNFRRCSFPMSLYQKPLSKISAGDLGKFFIWVSPRPRKICQLSVWSQRQITAISCQPALLSLLLCLFSLHLFDYYFFS